MIKANRSSVFEFFFGLYLDLTFKRNFKEIKTLGNYKDKGLPLLVISNHISWWDGFWIFRLNKRTLKRNLYVMMLEEQLRKNMFLRWLGAFSIKKSSRTIIDSLAYGAGVLHDPGNLLLLYPQGEFQSQYSEEQVFQNGWARILTMVNKPLQVVMVVHLLDYFSHPKPTLYQYIYSPDKITDFTSENLEESFNVFYKRCLENQKKLR
jgi:1-acyl-sn-glycerol-3-phosphate acyltransferase